MNTLPEEIQDTIFKYKHQMEFRRVVKELNTMGLCGWCWGKTCCKIDTCINCGKADYDDMRILNMMLMDSGDDSDLIVLDSDSDDSDLIVL